MEDEEIPKLSWDYQTFLLEGKRFYPDEKTKIVKLSCEPHSDLNWKIPEIEGRVIWEFDLGLHHPYFPLDDELRFEALAAALKHFAKTIWPQFKEKSLGGILYRGTADFASHFHWTELQRANEREWLEEKGSDLKELFCADAFAAYFQLLAHKLPDELPLVLCFDIRSIASRSRAVHLLSKERFEHFLLAVRSDRWPMPGLKWEGESLFFQHNSSQLGICFPTEAAMSNELIQRLDETMDRLDKENVDYRAIPEAFLTEQWDGLDKIYVVPGAISVQGQRKLRGFIAAGGEIIEEEIRGRGI
ncbi:MAG: hypothetical protein JSS32_10325 [Verrucomicrobia bacterium]|nr:hypothetical protein [Verrucomicrobiota bacterium]